MTPDLARYIAYGLIAATGALLLVRRRWLEYRIQRHIFETGVYCAYSPQSTAVIGEMVARRGFWHIMFDITCWDYSRYLLYPHHHETVQHFLDDPANLEDLKERIQRAALGEISVVTKDPEQGPN